MISIKSIISIENNRWSAQFRWDSFHQTCDGRIQARKGDYDMNRFWNVLSVLGFVAVSWIAAIVPIGHALAEECMAAADDADSMPVDIQVQIRETTGRRVEGKVRGHVLAVDQPHEFGADDSAPTPPETLAFAVGACVVSTARYIAILEKLDVRDIAATVRTGLDYARASGLKVTARAGLGQLIIDVTWKTSLDAAAQQSLLDKIRQRCPMCDNMQNQTPLRIQLKPDVPHVPDKLESSH